MAATGNVFPWQRLKALEQYIQQNKESFTKRFFDTDKYAVRSVYFSSNGLCVELIDIWMGDVTFKWVEGAKFKRWLGGYE